MLLRLKNARHLDATTVFALRALLGWFRQTECHLLVSGAHGDVLRVLKNSGLLRHIGLDNVFPAETNPTAATKKARQRARALIGVKPDLRVFYQQPAVVR